MCRDVTPPQLLVLNAHRTGHIEQGEALARAQVGYPFSCHLGPNAARVVCRPTAHTTHVIRAVVAAKRMRVSQAQESTEHGDALCDQVRPEEERAGM